MIKKAFCLSILVVAISFGSANASPVTRAPSISGDPSLNSQQNFIVFLPLISNTSSGGSPVFRDEFDNSSLDLGKWTTQYVWGRENPPELQYYAPDAFVLNNGMLQIKAEKKSIQGMNYSSGVITTFNSFQFTYGYVEARIRVPAGQGLWPALWLLDYGGSADEIDMMEILGHEPTITYMTLHYRDQNGALQNPGSSYTGPDFSAGFHLFAVDWSPTAVIWYVDGIERYRLTQYIPSHPMYLIINLAVGGNWPGSPNASTVFPAYYDVDYIRVFQP